MSYNAADLMIGVPVEFKIDHSSFGFGYIESIDHDTDTVVVTEPDGSRWRGSLDHVERLPEPPCEQIPL